MASLDLKQRCQSGHIVESVDEMDEGYYQALRSTLIVTADVEFIAHPCLQSALLHTPSLNARLGLLSVLQDEVAHGYIALRLLADLGEDIVALYYDRPFAQFKYPVLFDFPVHDWAEMVVHNALGDRCGWFLLSDILENGSYGPWRRALAKVGKEENFHVRHGEAWMRRLAADPAWRPAVQRAVDWLFPLCLEFFGLPDALKHNKTQLDYRIKARTNDELRQAWLASAVPFVESLGLKVPAHYDARQGRYVLDHAWPWDVDYEARRWIYDKPVTWEQVIARWKRGGPSREEFVNDLLGQAREAVENLARGRRGAVA